MKKLCRKGALCMVQAMRFEELMKKERDTLHQALPGCDRVLRVAAYNRTIRSFNLSSVRTELELHKVWRLKTDNSLFVIPGADVVYSNEGKYFVLPEKERR